MRPPDLDLPTGQPAPSADPPRRRRSDAQRNVAALLDAATSVFVVTGVDAPAKEITDLAGVGVGTLYRHFPRRSDLIVAVLQHEMDACVAAAVRLGATYQPWDALTAWVERFRAFVATKRGLAAALHSGDPAYDGLPQHLMEQLEPAVERLLVAARVSGDVRADVSANDVLVTVALLCQPVGGEDRRFSERMIRTFIEGLRHP